jgi:hypothetical protein
MTLELKFYKLHTANSVAVTKGRPLNMYGTQFGWPAAPGDKPRPIPAFAGIGKWSLHYNPPFRPSSLRFWFCAPLSSSLSAPCSRVTLSVPLPVLVRHIGHNVRSISRSTYFWDHAVPSRGPGLGTSTHDPLSDASRVSNGLCVLPSYDVVVIHCADHGCAAQGGPIRTKRSSAACTRCRRYRQKCVMEWVDGKAQVPCEGCVKAGRRVASGW